MQTFREKKLLFDFPDEWQVVQYDAKADPSTGRPAGFYRRVITGGGVKHIQAVDFICKPSGTPARLQFLEVKDDRQDVRAEGDRRTLLFEAVMGKVASTLAGLLIAERLGDQLDDNQLRPLACITEHPVIEVVLFWVESPVTGSTLRRLVKKSGKLDLQQRLTAKLYQWGMPFALYNLTDADRSAPEWTVREIS